MRPPTAKIPRFAVSYRRVSPCDSRLYQPPGQPGPLKLLYLAVAYHVGIAAGHILWQRTWFGCGISDLYWIAALAPIPICLWLDAAVPARAATPLRWPVSAGFAPPRAAPSPWLYGAILLAALCGTLRLASRPPFPCLQPSDLAYHNAPSEGSNRSAVAISGFVAGYPLSRDGRQRLDVEASAIWLDGVPQPVDGRVRLLTTSRHPFRYGEMVRVSGQLIEPPVFDGFDYRAYLARKQVHSLMRRPQVEPLPGQPRGGPLLRHIYRLRARGEALLNRRLPEPYAALANGMLLGIEAGIPDDLYEQFNLTGTSHVIVISGSNVALVSGLLMSLGIKLFGRRAALWPTLAGLVFYTLLVGGDAAVTRAALMGGLFVIATVFGRQSTALVSLGAACWAMTLSNPLTLWDVGFQLSGAATAGLILVGPPLTDRAQNLGHALTARLRRGAAPVAAAGRPEFLVPNSIRDLVRDSLLMTIAASVTTLPLILHYFERLSWISPITNLLIAPVQPLIMIAGGSGLIAGLLGLEQIAQILLWVPFVCLWWTVAIVASNAALPGAGMEIGWFASEHMALTYAAVLALYWRQPLQRTLNRITVGFISAAGAARRQASRSRRLAQLLQSMPSWAYGISTLAAVLIWWLALTQPDGQLHVHFLDIGQGDGIFIQTPSGRQLIIDGGQDSQQLFAQLGAVMPFWDRHVDRAVVTHPDADHIAAQIGLPRRFSLGRAIISANTLGHEHTEPWLDALGTKNVQVIGLQMGSWLDLGDGVSLWALWPPPEAELRGWEEDDKNERSLVLKLVYGDFTLLLTGDSGHASEEQLLRTGQPLAAQVLKVGHHGSDASTGPEFLEAVGSAVAVIQVGADNRYGHPDPDLLDRLQGQIILRNDKHGRVHIRSDGEQMWIETENGEISDLLARNLASNSQ